MKKFLIAGNWKMFTNVFESKVLVETLLSEIWEKEMQTTVLVCPPFTSLCGVADVIKDTDLKLGAQNCHYEEKGAYTGEISPQMLQYLGCDYIIIGHSERRTHFKEDDEIIARKLSSILDLGLTPILCIGETFEQRMNNMTNTILAKQIEKAFENIDKSLIKQVVIAYEPVWAIGTGISATPEQAQETHRWVKDFISSTYSVNREDLTVIYGGSMNDKNCYELLNLADVDGGLIGGASLNAETFTSIIETAKSISKI
ncbi:MAG: triose-phosphate isomerase [Candidatus Kapabacteria bacterium]|nr:triose-phosphate isomerase [Candidatus Kapabacteria bacterium]